VRRFESSLSHSGGQLGDNGHLARPGNDFQGFSSLRSSVLSIADPVLVGSKTERDTHHADNSSCDAAERARAASYQALDLSVKTRIRDDRADLAASAQHIIAYTRQVSVFLSILPPLSVSLLHYAMRLYTGGNRLFITNVKGTFFGISESGEATNKRALKQLPECHTVFALISGGGYMHQKGTETAARVPYRVRTDIRRGIHASKGH
jgi:hypothetical protein